MPDILESARIALTHVRGKSLESFLNDIQCQDAVIRRFEIIGEAARRVSHEFREDFPGLPWMEMIRMRNFVIHEYDAVDLVVVWETAMNDLPNLVAELERLFP